MANIIRPNWEEIYQAYDGSMTNCLGGNCSDSCCKVKDIQNWGKPRAKYFTSFSELSELEYNQRAFTPSFDELGIDIMRADTALDRGVRISYLVNKCMEDGQCKLKGRTPLQCRLFPFTLSTYMPLKTTCPQALKIAKEPEVIKGILHIRRLLGGREEEKWLHFLNKELDLAA